jgi:hypothetical protein
MMLSATAKGIAGQFWNDGDLMWQRVSRPPWLSNQ